MSGMSISRNWTRTKWRPADGHLVGYRVQTFYKTCAVTDRKQNAFSATMHGCLENRYHMVYSTILKYERVVQIVIME